MITLRKASDRGHFNHGWLDTWHTFSFADYQDPDHMGFSVLRVINEDRVAPGEGFDTHPHKDMEIVTVVLRGALRHRDSMGNGSVILPGEVQRMSAGTGVTHSEANDSSEEPVHLIQIWIHPERRGIEPGYEQKAFSDDEKRGRLRLLASPDGAGGSVTIHQDARIFASLLDAGASVTHALAPGRRAWVHLARGSALLGGHLLEAGDGAAVEDEREITLLGRGEGGEVLLFDLP